MVLPPKSAWILRHQRPMLDLPVCPNLVYLRVGEVENRVDLDETVLAGPKLRTFRGTHNPRRNIHTVCEFLAISRLSIHVTKVIVTLLANDAALSPDFTTLKQLRYVHIHGKV